MIRRKFTHHIYVIDSLSNVIGTVKAYMYTKSFYTGSGSNELMLTLCDKSLLDFASIDITHKSMMLFFPVKNECIIYTNCRFKTSGSFIDMSFDESLYSGKFHKQVQACVAYDREEKLDKIIQKAQMVSYPV